MEVQLPGAFVNLKQIMKRRKNVLEKKEEKEKTEEELNHHPHLPTISKKGKKEDTKLVELENTGKTVNLYFAGIWIPTGKPDRKVKLTGLAYKNKSSYLPVFSGNHAANNITIA